VATGVPFPPKEQFDRKQIFSRKVRVALYDTKSEAFFGNSTYVIADWAQSEEDKWKFQSGSSKATTNPIMFISSDAEIVNQDFTNIVFELIMEVKSSDGVINEFATGWCSVPLKDLRDPRSRSKVLKLEIKGGSADCEENISH
jgi:hypothetical protein